MNIKPTTYTELKHYFGNRVGIILLYHQEKFEMPPEQVEENRQGFIKGLEETIRNLDAGKITKAEGIGKAEIEGLISLAKLEEWHKPEALEAIKKAYVEITKEAMA